MYIIQVGVIEFIYNILFHLLCLICLITYHVSGGEMYERIDRKRRIRWNCNR